MELAVPVIPADDLGVAKEFYVGALGFDVSFEATKDGKTGLLCVPCGTMHITLDCPMNGHGRDACVSLRGARRRTRRGGNGSCTNSCHPQ